MLNESLFAITVLLWPWAMKSKISSSRSVNSGKSSDFLDTDDCPHQFIFVCVFKQITPRARAHGCKDRVIVVEHRNDQYTNTGLSCCDFARGFNAVHAWHF